jgi:phage FluMu protein Com
MVAAYKTVKGISCAKCGKLLDNVAMTPTARRSKQVVGTNEMTETVWEALHEGCMQ